jgi:hypothetical protein
LNITFEPILVALDDEKVEGRLVLADAHLIAVLVMLSPSHDEFAGKWFAEALFGTLAEEEHPVFANLEEARNWIISRWTMLLTYPLMTAIQQISAQIGRTTGRGIAGNIRLHYPSWLLQSIVALLFVANTINIGADLGAMADSVQLLIGGPTLLYVVMFGALCAVLQVFIEYNRYVSVLKWLTLALFAYVGTLAVVKIPWAECCTDFSFQALR